MSDGDASSADIVIVGAGAAGLATAIFAARRMPGRRIVALDGAAKLGAKILIAGGGRCNVTNERVTPEDFWGGSRNIIKRILARFPVKETIAFFHEIGVRLYVEENGKYFPNTNRARTVLDALLAEAARRGAEIRPNHRVHAIERDGEGVFRIRTGTGEIRSRVVVLATGGLSLPKTGSDGGGYGLARRLGHSLTPTTPGLVPLTLNRSFHAELSGVSQNVELCVAMEDEKPLRLSGALLWTHFGASGPVVLNASRHWHAAQLVHRRVDITLNLLPGNDFSRAEQQWLSLAKKHPKLSLANMLGQWIPARTAAAILTSMSRDEDNAGFSGIDGAAPIGQVPREARRRILRTLLAWPMPVCGSRGYAYAEVTAGGVPLGEINPRTMASRKCAGLYLAGEILDVDGRIGGFNFQWAWSSGFAAAEGIEKAWQ